MFTIGHYRDIVWSVFGQKDSILNHPDLTGIILFFQTCWLLLMVLIWSQGYFDRNECCDKSTLAQYICGQHLNSMRIRPNSEHCLMTPALASKHWTRKTSMRQGLNYFHSSLLSFLSSLPSPSSIWFSKEHILIFCPKLSLRQWWTEDFNVALLCTGQIFIYFLEQITLLLSVFDHLS